MAKSFTVTLLALVLLSVAVIGNAFVVSPDSTRLPQKKAFLHSTTTTQEVSYHQETEQQDIIQKSSSRVKSISPALGIPFLIARASTARNAEVVRNLGIPSMKVQKKIGSVSSLLRKALLGVIPGVVMTLFGGLFQKTLGRTKNDSQLTIIAATTTTTLGEQTTTMKAETASKVDPTLFEDATSDMFPLMDRKYVHARESMRNEGAAKRAAKRYAKIESLEDRTFQMLLDLGLAQEHENPAVAL
jgi:hypothetical protein